MDRNMQAPDSSAPVQERPALAVLRCVVAHGRDGVTGADLAEEGWPTQVVSAPLNALRSRGYVALDRSTGHWVATDAGRRRAGETAPPVDGP